MCDKQRNVPFVYIVSDFGFYFGVSVAFVVLFRVCCSPTTSNHENVSGLINGLFFLDFCVVSKEKDIRTI